jgi:hypothetical protein
MRLIRVDCKTPNKKALNRKIRKRVTDQPRKGSERPSPQFLARERVKWFRKQVPIFLTMDLLLLNI